jgi:two-component sensor histidine kinase
VPRLFRTTRTRVLAFLLVCSVPTMGLALSDAHANRQRQAMAAAERAALLREAAAGNVVAAIEGAHQMLATLRSTPPVRDGTAEACASLLQSVVDAMAARYTGIVLVGPDGMLRCASRLRDEAPSDMSVLAFFREARARGGFVVSRISIGVGTGIHNLAVAMPGLAPADAPAGGAPVLAVGIRSDFLLQAGRRLAAPPATAIWIIDEANGSLALTEAASDAALPDAATAARVWDGSGQAVRGTAHDGSGFTYAAGTVQDDLRLIVGLADADWQGAADAAFRRRMLELAGILIVSLCAVLAALNLSVAGPIQTLAARVRGWQEQSGPFRPGNLQHAPAEVQALADAFAAATQALADRQAAQLQALAAREAMLAETHHRVKNNLQIVASLLNLQSDRAASPDARTELHAAASRIGTLSIVHRHLYLHGDPKEVELRPFLNDIARQALGGPGERIALVLDAPAMMLPADAALPLALIVNELVGNAVQHAFDDGRAGRVTVRLTALEPPAGMATLVVEDDGSGHAEAAADGLGTRLIRALSRQLGGTLAVAPRDGGGSRVALSFPLAARRAAERPAVG